MDTQKLSSDEGSSGSVIVGVTAGKPRTRRTRLAIVALLVAMFCTAFAITYIVGHHNKHTKKANNLHGNTASQQDFQKPQVTVYDKALAQADKGDVASAQALLQKQLAEAGSLDQKVKIYNQMMSVAVNAGHYDKAIELGEAADRIKPTTNTAQVMYSVYLKQGDTTNAKKWLQLAIDRLQPGSPGYNMAEDSLHRKLAELQK